MKTTKEEIVNTALRLFAQRGFDGVSTGDIARQLGITKGALYRHFESKQAIFDAILARMTELDAQRADDSNVPEKTYEEDAESYRQTELRDLCGFLCSQFDFWTQDPFAADFRRLMILAQYRSPQMSRLCQDTLFAGPVLYSADVFRELAAAGRLSPEAAAADPQDLAVQLFAPLALMLQMFDGGADPAELKGRLERITKENEDRWTWQGR